MKYLENYSSVEDIQYLNDMGMDLKDEDKWEFKISEVNPNNSRDIKIYITRYRKTTIVSKILLNFIESSINYMKSNNFKYKIEMGGSLNKVPIFKSLNFEDFEDFIDRKNDQLKVSYIRVVFKREIKKFESFSGKSPFDEDIEYLNDILVDIKDNDNWQFKIDVDEIDLRIERKKLCSIKITLSTDVKYKCKEIDPDVISCIENCISYMGKEFFLKFFFIKDNYFTDEHEMEIVNFISINSFKNYTKSPIGHQLRRPEITIKFEKKYDEI
jgi:hypothetical protein